MAFMIMTEICPCCGLLIGDVLDNMNPHFICPCGYDSQRDIIQYRDGKRIGVITPRTKKRRKITPSPRLDG